MKQPGLFDSPRPPWTGLARASDPETSKGAAARIAPSTAHLEALVLAELRRGPGTTHELADRLTLSLVTVSPRMAPLERKGLVRRNGRRGGSAVWELIDKDKRNA